MNRAAALAHIQPHYLLMILCAGVFGVYQVLIYSSPIIYWDDAHIRWALRDQLLLETWLPVIQVFVILSSKITSSLYFLKTIMSFLAIGTLVSLYVLTRHLFSPRSGLIAVLFLAFTTMFAALAIVPYAEVLFIGLVFLALYLLDDMRFTPRFCLGLVILNLASLTRYAGWYLSVIFITGMALHSFRNLDRKAALRDTLKMALLCSLAPFLWLIFGVPESGTLWDRLWSIFEFVAAPAGSSLREHILIRLNPAYLQDFSSQYFRLLTSQVGAELLLLAGIGFIFAISDSLRRMVHFLILSFLIADWCALAFLQPWKFGNLRQPFLVEAFIVLYAAHGLVEGISRLSRTFGPHSARVRTWALALAIPVLSFSILRSMISFVLENSRNPARLMPYEIGRWLDENLKEDDAVLVLDDTDYYPYALGTYMEYPLERILDDRLDARFVREGLDAARMAYVIALYTSRDGLSADESRLLEDLESGHIRADRIFPGKANVWYVAANELVDAP